MPSVSDTGFLVAYWDTLDPDHRWARGLPNPGPLYTCEEVLAEADYLLGRSDVLVRMIIDGDLLIDFDLNEHTLDLWKWLRKYADLEPGLTDACVVKMGELKPQYPILTTDRRHFAAYRTLAGKPLNCIFPDR